MPSRKPEPQPSIGVPAPPAVGGSRTFEEMEQLARAHAGLAEPSPTPEPDPEPAAPESDHPLANGDPA